MPLPTNYNPLPIEAGGTASITPSAARTALGIQIPLPATSVNFLQSGTGAVVITLSTWIEAQPINGAAFGVVVGGDMSPAIATMITNLKAKGGGEILLPRGVITLNGITGSDSKKNGILIPYTSLPTSGTLANRVMIRGHGKSTILKANSTGMYVLRVSDSQCGFENFSIDGASLGTVSGLGVVPENTGAQPAGQIYQGFNNFKDIEIRNCVEGLELMTGGNAVDASVCECRDNRFYDLNILFCTRARWLRSSFTTGPQCNRNKFYGGRGGQSCNTGYQIDAGAQNEDHGFDYEGISLGASPNATPTGLKIANNDAWGVGNNNNKFFGGSIEENGVTRHIDNANPTTELHGLTYDGAKVLFTANPLISFGGNGASFVPQIGPAYFYQESSQISGYSNKVPYIGQNAAAVSGQLTMFPSAIQAIRNLAITVASAVGGSATIHRFACAYSEGVTDYLVARGGYDATGLIYARRVSIFSETSSGTFIESARLVDIVSAATVFATDTLTRAVFGYIDSTVSVTKATVTFTNYASVTRLA